MRKIIKIYKLNKKSKNFFCFFKDVKPCYTQSMRIIVSNSARGATDGVLKHLSKNLSASAHNIVIAPDRFTASVERNIIASLHIEGSFGIDVMSFTRLANKIIGKDIKKCLTPEGSVMLIGKVITDLQDELQYYGRVAMAEGFAHELYAALTAIRNSGITSQKLLEREADMSPALRAKTHDIALIYDGYLKALEEKHSDSSTRLYALAKYIEDNPSCIADTNFYCMDIYDFSQPEYEILTQIARNALSFTVGITSGYDNENKRIYPNYILKKLKSLTPDKVEIEKHDEYLCPPIDAISKKLFAYVDTSADFRAKNDGKVKLRVAKDRNDEVLSLAMDIEKAVRAGGRYKDFEVFVSDLDEYEGEITAIFKRYDIPFFIDKKALLLEQTKSRYILSALACVRSGFRLREVLDFVKNPLFCSKVQGGEESVFLFENYCLKYNIMQSRFFKEFTLKDEKKLQKRYFMIDKTDDKTVVCKNAEENTIPEQVRQTLVSTLSKLKEKDSISGYVASAKALLDDIDKEWQQHVEKLSAISEYYLKCAEQVDDKLLAVLNEIDDVLCYDTDIIGFESVFKAMLKTLKIALVPTFLDCVFIGDKDSSFSGDGNIYILGANNGKFPNVGTGGTVITQKDETLLSTLGVEIYPCQRQKALTSMYDVCELMKKPKGKLVVSYAQMGGGGALRPSTVIFELQNMLCENGAPLDIERVCFDDFRGRQDDDIALMFATKKACRHEVLKNVYSGRNRVEYKDIYSAVNEFVDIYDKQRIDSAFNEPEYIDMPNKPAFEGRTSVSRIETFYHCPMRYYFNYILSLKKRKDGEFEGTENGTILHFVLEKFFSDVRDGNIDKTNIAKNAYRYFDEAIVANDFQPLMDKQDTRRLLLRVRDEGVRLCGELYETSLHSKFRPTMLEAKIGEGEIKPMSLDDGKIELKGTIDRVDILDDKFLIIDYKTYKSADLTLKELYYGEKVQLYIYMRAIENSLDLKPCGVFYLPVFASFTEEDESRHKYKGFAINSIEVLGEIDDRVTVENDKAIAPYKVDKKTNALSEPNHLSYEKMDMLGDYAVAITTKGAQEIAKGYIKPTCVKDECDRCDFASICAYKGRHERKISAVKSLSSLDLKGDKENE